MRRRIEEARSGTSHCRNNDGWSTIWGHSILALLLVWMFNTDANRDRRYCVAAQDQHPRRRLQQKSSASQEVVSTLQISGFMDSSDFQFCYSALNEADANNDQRVTSEEYVAFAQLMSPPGLIDDITAYSDLPLAYQAAFLGTACLCQDEAFGGNPNDTVCCRGQNANIRIPGATPDSANLSVQDKMYLYAACSYTTSAAETAMIPTPAPTRRPTPTPTTARPTTPAPTPAPTTPAPTAPQEPPVVSTPPVVVEQPTPSPTIPVPVDVTAQVPYEILVANGKNFSSDDLYVASYVADLRRAMNELAEEVVAATFGGTVSTASLPSSSGGEERRRKLASSSSSLSTRLLRLRMISTNLLTQNEYHEHQRRRLDVDFVWPTQVGTLVDVECPEGVGPNDLCQNAISTVTLQLTNEDDPDQIVTTYEAALSQAIEDGRLQVLIDQGNPESPVLVLTDAVKQQLAESGQLPGSGSGGGGDEGGGIGPGGIAGIVIAVVVVAGGIGLLMYNNAQNDKPASEKQKDYEPFDKNHQDEVSEDRDHGAGSPSRDDDADGATAAAKYQSSMEDNEIYTDTSGSKDGAAAFAPAATAAVLGATSPDYGRASRRALEAMAAGEDIVAEPELDNVIIEPDSSSNAGSSGWSSSAGISSLNTGSIDDSMDAAAAAGATLAAIGVSSALARKMEDDPSKSALGGAGSAPDNSGGDVSRTQLDALIEAGDWAAVGATAALLAAASDSQSNTSRSHTSARSGSRSFGESLDAARAAELDNLVDAGDWEGVVLAAAKFEAAESSVAESRSTADSLGTGTHDSGASGTRSGTAGTPSVETSVTSDDPSRAQRRAEIRAEVEALVRRVVPEEIDNVDEMMNQFKGREEELVETLRTMQERSVAQKARTVGQKAAKVEARRSVQRGVVPGVPAQEAGEGTTSSIGAGAAAALGIVTSAAASGTEGRAGTNASIAASAASNASTGNRASSEATGSLANRQTALELAIESGDWEAVGEAAAMMSDASTTTASTGELGRLGGDSSAASSSVSSKRTRSLEGSDSKRAAELDAMIEKGDWTGVVEATKRFKESDKGKKNARSKEEEEALAQAEAWMKIAAQTKKEGVVDAGASDAAEWAIQRSLSQMRQAEKQQQQKAAVADSEEDEV